MLAKRIREIAETLTPLGWRIQETRACPETGGGWCQFQGRIILVPKLRTVHALYVLLHEYCHATRHGDRRLLRSLEEYEAEWFAIRGLRSRGFSVSREEIHHAKANVNKFVLRDIAAGYKVPARVRRWAQPGKINAARLFPKDEDVLRPRAARRGGSGPVAHQ